MELVDLLHHLASEVQGRIGAHVEDLLLDLGESLVDMIRKIDNADGEDRVTRQPDVKDLLDRHGICES